MNWGQSRLAECGTRRGYDIGCRCYECRAANARYHRQHREWIRAGRPQVGPDMSLEPLEEAVLIALHHLPARPFNSRECGEILGLTRQRVEQICQGAMEKIAHRLQHWRDEGVA